MSQPPPAAQPQWRWDDALGKWYWYDSRTDTLVYQDGQRVARSSRDPRTPFPSAGPQASVNTSQFADNSYNPGNGGNYSTSSEGQYTPYGSMSPSSDSPASSRHAPPQPGRRLSVSVGSVAQQLARTGLQNPAPDSGQGNQDYRAGPLQPRVTTTSNGQVVTYVQDDHTGVRTVFQTQPPGEFTDPVLWQSGIRSYRNLYAPDANDNEQLFPGFRKRDQPKKFFTVGKVFLVLWVEPMGESVMTTFVPGESVGRYGERVYSKVRRFIVIRQAENYCTCLPIMSYGKQGVGKPTVKKSEHSIVFSTKEPPDPLPEEKPRRGEEGMRPQAIKVDVDDPAQKLDHTSRLDYGKVYTIQHNIKVASFGKVNPRSMNALVHQFGNVWNSQPVLGPIGAADQQAEVSSGASGRQRAPQRRESHSARSGASTGSRPQVEPQVHYPQRNDSLLAAGEASKVNPLQQYARAAAKRLIDQGYTEAQAVAAVQAEYRNKKGKETVRNDDDDDDDDEEDNNEEDGDDKNNAANTKSKVDARSTSGQHRSQTQRSAQSQAGQSTMSSQSNQGKMNQSSSSGAVRTTSAAIGQAGPSSIAQSQQQYSASLTGSASSVLSRAQPGVVQAMMADYLKKGYTKEQALKLIQQQLSKKGPQ